MAKKNTSLVELLVGATLFSSVALLIGYTLVSSCDMKQYSADQEKKRQEAIVLEQKRIEILYNHAIGMAHYNMPTIEITAKKVSYTLDPFTHFGNELKAQKISLPVSKKFYDSVTEGQTLDSKFDWVKAVFSEGDFATYNVYISDKALTDYYCCIDSAGITSIDGSVYSELISQNQKQNRLVADSSGDVYTKKGYIIPKSFFESKKITIESYKTNFSLDIFQHIANSMNIMGYDVEIPAFMADNLKVGDIIDQNFVGASLFFSSSPSIVSFKVKSKE
jgi:hypothetical protein